MLFLQTNHRIIATYGVGSGNAPALTNCSVGHLRVAFFLNLLKTISYVYLSTKWCCHGNLKCKSL